MTPPRQTFRFLPWAAAGTWLLWAISVADMAWYYTIRAEHPSYVPILALLTSLALAGIVLLGGAAIRLVRGPVRRRAIGWLMVGLTPLFLAAAHLGLSAWYQFRDHSLPNAPSKWAASAFASVGDLVARIRHPHCSTGKRVVMFHDADDQAASELASLDEHVERMEELLGKSSTATAHLYRGPVFDASAQIAGWYLCGLAIVEMHGETIGSLDRHELAHAVVDFHSDIDAVPPAVLVEGWAESQSGYDEAYLAQRAWRRCLRGERMSLQAMTGDAFYFAADWHCYELGGPLVDYLLRAFGGPKFLELYTTCRPESFAADVKRVYGLSLSQLDERYWADIADQVAHKPSPFDGALAAASVSDGVDREQWEVFAHDFATAVQQPTAETGPVIVEYIRKSRGSEGEAETETNEIIRSGDRHRWLMRTSKNQQLVLATPELTCFVTRPNESADWSFDDWDSLHRRPADYWNCLRFIEIADWPSSGDYNDLRSRMFVESVRRENFRVTHLSHDHIDGEPTARLECEYFFSINGGNASVQNRFVLLPNRHFAIREYEIRHVSPQQTTVESGTLEYPADDRASARPTRMEHHLKGRRSQAAATWELVRYEPWSDALDVFDSEQLGISRAQVDACYRPPWYLWCWGPLAAVSLIVGLALLMGGRTRPQPDSDDNHSVGDV